MLRARLFGGLAVDVEGRSLPPIPGFRAQSLFAYLLLHPGPHPRIRLAGRFWPDVMDTSARASLRVALFTLRKALDGAGGSAYLAADRLSAGLAADLPRWVDVEHFDNLLVAGDARSLGEAVGLYQGPVLAELPDEWVLEIQDDYRLRAAGACERLGDLAEADGDLAKAADGARRAIAYDPIRETCHRALIARLAAAGRQAEALAAYGKCRAVLKAELGVEPSPETQALARRLTAAASPGAAPGTPVAAPRPPAGPPLVGRESEVRQLERWFGAAMTGGPGGIGLLTGEAGIGKTRIAAELAAVVEARGVQCAVGCAFELTGGPTFALWSDALRALVNSKPAPGAHTWSADLARLVPSVTAQWGQPPSLPSATPDLDRARLFEAVVELLGWAAAERPLLLVFDDLHLADSASLALLAYAGRRLPELRVFVLGTRRPSPANPELDALIDGFERRGILAGELALPPLGAQPVRTIAAAMAPGLSGAALEEVVQRADGNPFLAREVARSMARNGSPFEGLRALVRGPLNRLDPSARLLVDLAAAAARPLEASEAASLVGADALNDALMNPAIAELLDLTSNRQIRFAHSLLREACYQELPAARSGRLHARLAEVLARRPGRSAAEVARHRRLAGDLAGSCSYLMVAASAARSLGALDDAAALLEEAAQLATGEPSREADVWLAIADIEAWRGRRGAWEHAFGLALSLLRDAGDPLAVAQALALRGRWLRTTLCYPREALAAYREALEILDDRQLDAPEVRALSLAGAAWAEGMAGDPAAVEALASASEAIPEAAADVILGAEVALARAAALVRVGRMAEAERLYGQAARAAHLARRPDLAGVAWMNVSSIAACRGEFERALEWTLRGLAGDTGSPYVEAVLRAGEAHILARIGRPLEAMAAADAEYAIAQRSGLSDLEAMAEFDLGVVALRVGRAATAVEHLRVALGASEPRYFSRPLARVFLAEAWLGRGEFDEAEHELNGLAFEPVGPADLPDTLVARVARIEGLAAAGRGESMLAIQRLGEAEDAWRRRRGRAREDGQEYASNIVDLGRPPVAGLIEPALELGRVLSERARVLAEAGRGEEAAAAAREALDLADAVGFDAYRADLQSSLTGSAPRA